MIIDISQEILTCRIYPGDPKPKLNKINDINNDLYNLSEFSMCAHNGTHIDAPSHFIKNGKTIDEIPLDYFVGYCFVYNHNGDVLKQDAINILNKAKELDAGDRILIKGDATITLEAALVFKNSNIKLLGNESQSVGPVSSPMEVHLALLGADIVLLEGLNLADVEDGKYYLCAQPLNIKGIEGSPCRAILIK
ncbi:MAG: cyclase family protein [Acholeplasmatales bacterium]|nr:cyclase family protein [Acholeplasmatales bacterium]